MKKTLFIVLIAVISFITACTKCGTENAVVATDSIAKINVEHTVSADRESMFADYGADYRWFETSIVLKDFLDSDSCDGTIVEVTNVMQAIECMEGGADVYVVIFTHTPDTLSKEVIHSFWVEDHPLNNETIKLTYEEAFEKVMATNSPKPHSKHCVLRKEVGPVDCNPQYIFGNIEAQLYVDAITGEVRDYNPAYEKDVVINTPLGEWP